MPDHTRPDAHKKKEELVENQNVKESKPTDITPLISSILSRITLKDESPMEQVGFTLPAKENEPARFVTLNELVKEQQTFEDLALVHEIAVDEEFTLKKASSNDVMGQVVAQTMRNVYWDMMRKELNKVPPNKEMAIALLMDIKKAFRALLEGNNDKALVYIENFLDEKEVRRQIDTDEKAVNSYTDFIINMMGMACCRARDEEVSELNLKPDLVGKLRGIMELLEAMQLDMANFILGLARGELSKHSIEYEKKKFTEVGFAGGKNYPFTHAWLMRSFDARNPTDDAPTEAVAVAGPSKPRVNVQEILISAYLELLELNEYPFPELLLLDKGRLIQLRAQLMRLTICCAVIGFACRWGLQLDEQNRADLAEKLMILAKDCTNRNHLKDGLESLWVQVQTMIRDENPQDKIILKAQILGLEQENTPVYSVIKKKLLIYLKEKIEPGAKEGGAVPMIFKDYAREVFKLGKTYQKIVQHNRAVYGEYYESVINNF